MSSMLLPCPTAIPVFKPTLEEMKDFSSYIGRIEELGAHKAGLAKIIPPPEWAPRKASYNSDDVWDINIPNPVKQKFWQSGNRGVYSWNKNEKRKCSVKQFKNINDKFHRTPEHSSLEELENIYWATISGGETIYGADVQYTLFDSDCREFNLNKLDTIFEGVCEDSKISIPGVTSNYLYFGTWKSTFAWHTEDMDLYSINYLHFGAPKSWYVIPPQFGLAFERLASSLLPEFAKKCSAFLRHKTTLISPCILEKVGIPYLKTTQFQREFMVTFPYGYHAGYNTGWNCAEATNFALPRWIEYGKRATLCQCGSSPVNFPMDPWVEIYQPELIQDFLMGEDYGDHPETLKRVRALNRFDFPFWWKKDRNIRNSCASPLKPKN